MDYRYTVNNMCMAEKGAAPEKEQENNEQGNAF